MQAGPWPDAWSFTYQAPPTPTPQTPQGRGDNGDGGIQTTYAITHRSTYFLAGQAIAIRRIVDGGSSNLLYLHNDHLGSNSVMSYASAGGMVSGSRARYLPFGAYRTAPTQTFTDRGYTGQKHNDDIGLIYYNARYYLPGVSRFVSADTIVPDAGNPQSFNRYSYGYNNPIVYSDPTGHLSIAEIENYFGYTTEQQMIDAYGQAVAKQLWNTRFTWGDVLKYDCAECIDGKGYAMLVLKGNQSDEFRGAFWGLEAIHNGHDFRGKEVSAGFLHQATDASLDLD